MLTVVSTIRRGRDFYRNKEEVNYEKNDWDFDFFLSCHGYGLSSI